jgi:DnaK suppressor protein
MTSRIESGLPPQSRKVGRSSSWPAATGNKAGDTYLTPTRLNHFRSVLASLRDQLVTEIDRTVQTMQVETTSFADPNDRASHESDRGLELRNRNREGKLIRKIEEAIARIDVGEYGYCTECGVEIGLKRLQARPTATLCIDCKTIEELRERQVVR